MSAVPQQSCQCGALAAQALHQEEGQARAWFWFCPACNRPLEANEEGRAKLYPLALR